MKEASYVEQQFERVARKLEETEPGTKEYDDLLKEWDKLFECLLDNEKAVVDQELKESELQMKQDELSKKWYKRPEIIVQLIVQLIGAGLSVFEIGQILHHEDTGAITSKAMNFMHKLRIR